MKTLFALFFAFCSFVAISQSHYVQDDFAITFPGEDVKMTSSEVDTDAGTVTIVTHMYEKSEHEVYMVAENRYNPTYIEGADVWALIEGGRDGSLESLGIEKTEYEARIDVGGYPSLFFRAKSDQYFVVYQIVLVDETLFQVAFLSDISYPTVDEENAFFGTFRLHMSTLHRYETDDFAINFPGDEVEVSSSTVDTDIGPTKLVFHMYEKSASEAYMVGESHYDSEAIKDGDPWVLMNGGRDGALESLEIKKAESEERGQVDGYPELTFRAHNDTYYVVYRLILVENVLFQVAVLATEEYPSDKELEDFLDSFELKIKR